MDLAGRLWIGQHGVVLHRDAGPGGLQGADRECRSVAASSTGRAGSIKSVAFFISTRSMMTRDLVSASSGGLGAFAGHSVRAFSAAAGC